MEKMTDLQDLLKHEIKDLYSAEEQIIEAMPRMIEKVTNPQLRQALERHLRITEEQLTRLEQVQQLMAQGGEQENGNEGGKEGNNGLFARLMKRRSQGGETGNGGEKCLGMQGLLKEGEKMLAEEMEATVLDAAIIACAQKIEHYEICGYGTARAYARELNLGQVAELLEQTLDEEYEADDRLTDMAIGRVNEEAQKGGSGRRSASSSTGRSNGRSSASKSTARSRTAVAEAASSKRGGSASGRGASSSSRSTSSSSSGRSTGRKTAAKSSTSGRSSSPAPASKTSSSRTGASKSAAGRSASTGNTRSVAGSRSGKAPSKAAAAKGGRNSSGGGRTASKGSTRGSSNGRSTGRR